MRSELDWSNRRPDDGVANASVSSIWRRCLKWTPFLDAKARRLDEPASEEMMEQINTSFAGITCVATCRGMDDECDHHRYGNDYSIGAADDSNSRFSIPATPTKGKSPFLII